MTENLAEGLAGLEIVDYADGTHGSYCIARTHGEKWMEYWNPDGWKAFGYVFKDKQLAEAVIAALEAAAPPSVAHAALIEASKNLLEACYQADALEELPQEIDGSLLDAVRDGLLAAAALATPSPQAPLSADYAKVGTAENVATSTNADTRPIAKDVESFVGLLLPDAEWNSLSSDSQRKIQKWFEIATEHLEQMLRPTPQASSEIREVLEAAINLLPGKPSEHDSAQFREGYYAGLEAYRQAIRAQVGALAPSRQGAGGK